jgi:hypothetical protein
MTALELWVLVAAVRLAAPAVQIRVDVAARAGVRAGARRRVPHPQRGPPGSLHRLTTAGAKPMSHQP